VGPADVTGDDSDDSSGPAEVHIAPADVADLQEVLPDLLLPETAGEVVAWECLEEGQPGCPCGENEDCKTGFCVFHRGDRVCTTACMEECPPGWACKEMSGFGSDAVFICVSKFQSLCLPCSTSDECFDFSDRCVLYENGAGSFCGGACDADQPCPNGYDCKEMMTMEGIIANQCVSSAGQCECSSYAKSMELGTHCYKSNDWGTCSAWRSCGEEGLGECQAPAPAQEVCYNDQDEDCDGIFDDPDECCFCEGKECGDDGCGNSCGDCPDNHVCTDDNVCVCVPACQGKECGTDGCDGICGECPPNHVCGDGQQCLCVPDCGGKACGDDGCKGNCGECPVNHVCTAEQACVCVPNCDGKECGPDGCGDACGQCGPGTKCIFSQCQEGCDGNQDCADADECVEGFCQPDVPDSVKLLPPLVVESIPGSETGAVSAQVLEAGVTEGAGTGNGVQAQLGFGPPLFDPEINPQEWTWKSALFDKDDGQYDVWKGNLSSPVPGTYAYTYRFSLDGEHWVYADSSGSEDGFALNKLGKWTVLADPEIDKVNPPFGTVLGGDSVTIHGSDFKSGLTLVVGGIEVPVDQVTADSVSFKTPAHAAGEVSIELTNPSGQSVSQDKAFNYVLQFSPTVDGDLSEWNAQFTVAQNGLESNWDQEKNRLEHLVVAYDTENLYVGFSGKWEEQNYAVGYVDVDFGKASGTFDMIGLSDNDGDGDLDDALSNVLKVSVAGYGGDYGFGSRGMASFETGGNLDDAAFVGWRELGPPYNLAWLQGSVVCTPGGTEAAIPLATIYPAGVPDNGTQVAVFVKLTDRYGDLDGISNQTLPEYYDADDVKNIGTVAVFDLVL